VRLTRCFIATPLESGAIVTLPPAAAAHVTRVLRLGSGAALTLFDGRGGEYDALLLEVGRHRVQARVGQQRAVERETPVRLALLQCLARAERMDWVVQKATELGVASIVPVSSRRSVVQLDAAARPRRLEHWQAVAISACEQCGRNRPPRLQALQELEAACNAADPASLRLLLDPDAALSLPAALTAAASAAAPAALSVTLLVGPEGGFAEPELQAALRCGFCPCRLGPRILRAETAPIAALAAIQALAGDFL
jgi:16S rRNA (uracil1498-N3)-methyltransferase